MSAPGNGWGEWKAHVLAELSRNNEDHRKMMDDIRALSETSIRNSVRLSIQSALIGAAVAAIPTVIALLR